MVGAFVEPHAVLKTSELIIRLILRGISLMDGALLEITDHLEIEKNGLNSSIQFSFSGLFHHKEIAFFFEHQISYSYIFITIIMQIENRGSEVME